MSGSQRAVVVVVVEGWQVEQRPLAATEAELVVVVEKGQEYAAYWPRF
jgi:hypothetical protein